MLGHVVGAAEQLRGLHRDVGGHSDEYGVIADASGRDHLRKSARFGERAETVRNALWATENVSGEVALGRHQGLSSTERTLDPLNGP